MKIDKYKIFLNFTECINLEVIQKSKLKKINSQQSDNVKKIVKVSFIFNNQMKKIEKSDSFNIKL